MDFIFENTGDIFVLAVIGVVFINRKIKARQISKTLDNDIVDVDYEIIYTFKNSLFTRFYTPWD